MRLPLLAQAPPPPGASPHCQGPASRGRGPPRPGGGTAALGPTDSLAYVEKGGLYDFRKQMGMSEPWLYLRTRNTSFVNYWRYFDLTNLTWSLLPDPVRGCGGGAYGARAEVRLAGGAPSSLADVYGREGAGEGSGRIDPWAGYDGAMVRSSSNNAKFSRAENWIQSSNETTKVLFQPLPPQF